MPLLCRRSARASSRLKMCPSPLSSPQLLIWRGPLGGEACWAAALEAGRKAFAGMPSTLTCPLPTPSPPCQIVTGDRPQRGNMRMPRVPDECPQVNSSCVLDMQPGLRSGERRWSNESRVLCITLHLVNATGPLWPTRRPCPISSWSASASRPPTAPPPRSCCAAWES